MKYLLITNNKNPGDIWVKVGIKKIIKSLDPSASFVGRYRDTDEKDQYRIENPVKASEFDISVICGMPLLWSHHELPEKIVSSTTQHSSWKELSTWASEKKRMIVAGFGIYLICHKTYNDFDILDRASIVREINEKLFSKCRAVYSRSPLASKFWPNVPTLVCPSVFASDVKYYDRELKLCNLMPGGAHYPHLNPGASEIMKKKMPSIAEKLLHHGFRFMAHSTQEFDLAKKLGWTTTNIYQFTGDPIAFLDIYARCSHYFGNRIHGGIISRAMGANVIVVGYDTRIADVEMLGGQVYTPSTLPDLSEWLKDAPTGQPFDRGAALDKTMAFWREALKD